MKKFDGIIACGDSFTWYNKNVFEDTWPYLLGEHYGVPVVNLGRGGASNFEIAFQPLQSDTYQKNETFMGEFAPKNPLVIFGITTMYRIPMLFPKEGVMGTISSILPEDFGQPGTKSRYGFDDKAFLPMAMQMLAKDQYNIADYQAVKMMARLQTLMPHATVMWGSIHTQTSEPYVETDGNIDQTKTAGIGFTKDIERLKDYHNRLNEEGIKNICFNQAMDWLPLSTVHHTTNDGWKNFMPSGDYFINDGRFEDMRKDFHPNSKGIQRFSDAMIDCIDYFIS
jgi:hypothetical protein|tara:strand:- start:6472 stop:7317 length:846 start_codon:yes stop_codon:yes gene_type:complete